MKKEVEIVVWTTYDNGVSECTRHKYTLTEYSDRWDSSIPQEVLDNIGMMPPCEERKKMPRYF